MKVKIFSEELPGSGVEVDWPVVPRIGEVVCFKHSGGTSNLAVDDVRWQVDTDGHYQGVEIRLTFGEVRSPFDRFKKKPAVKK